MKISARSLLLATTFAVASSAVFAQTGAPQASTAPELIAAAASAPAFSGSLNEQPATESSSLPATAALPDAPSATDLAGPALRASFISDAGLGQPTSINAPRYAKYIDTGETAQTITASDKFVLSLRQLYSPISLTGSLISAGYEHLTNGAPNYGTNGGAFAQRFGASVVRGSSQELFSDGILDPMFHMDPRYYILGHDYNVAHRAFYAVTRVFVTRTDRGHTTINAPLLIGYAGAAGLSTVYYPPINRNFKDTAAEYAGSLGGAALGLVFSEFASDLLRAIHLQN